MTEKEPCGCCGYELAPEKLTDFDYLHRQLVVHQRQMGPLCEICANTLFVNSIRYGEGGDKVCVSDIAQAFGYIGNMILAEIRKEKE